MDYGIENTTHDKAYFDGLDKEFTKEQWLQNRTTEIASEILTGDHKLYTVNDCVVEHVYNGNNEGLANNFIAGLRQLADSKNCGSKVLWLAVNRCVDRQSRILAEGELAAMESEDDC